MKPSFTPLITGKQVYLRDRFAADVDCFISWQTQGEWLQYDAPWVTLRECLTTEQETKIRSHFLESVAGELPEPRKSAVIVLRKVNQLIGFVNRYGNERFTGVYYVGIDICDDRCLNQGLGTEALTLWVD